MDLIRVRRVLACAVLVAVSAAVANPAFAQTLGAPQVTILADNVVIVSYAAPSTPPASAVLAATLNGVPIGPFPIGTATSVSSATPVPPGAYTVQVVWSATVTSPVTSFVVSGGGAGAPAATIMRPASVFNGNSVTVTWDPIANATSYELEAVFFEGPRTFTMAVPGGQTSLVVTNVPFGNYMVRVRGRNSLGAGPYSNQVLVTIGGTIRVRDLEINLTWNTLADMDLHVIEPDGRHVWWERRNGVTAFLEADNTTGFGPETAYVHAGGAALGVYQIYLVHYRNNFPTASTVTITLNSGNPNARTVVFNRTTQASSGSVGYNVALVDVRGGLISEAFGTRAALMVSPPVKPEE